MNKFYDYQAKSLTGASIEMSKYQGKVVLVVNTASKCGFTPQYTGLQKLHNDHHADGLEILGFPCNQFGKQEPGNSDTIKNECLINYGVTFQMFKKIDVNGKEAHPLYDYLKGELKGTIGKSIRWNFTKFLLDRTGKSIKRFSPNTTPEQIEKYIIKLLKETAESVAA
ncbi:MAG: glutathione peroxidase [Candidatus Marinimicrobia bacterium]|nr:glutathione peroxidase [Candidatus Neomarinimicrobiota bacterium]